MHKYNVENDACVVKDLTMQKDSQNVKKVVNTGLVVINE